MNLHVKFSLCEEEPLDASEFIFWGSFPFTSSKSWLNNFRKASLSFSFSFPIRAVHTFSYLWLPSARPSPSRWFQTCHLLWRTLKLWCRSLPSSIFFISHHSEESAFQSHTALAFFFVLPIMDATSGKFGSAKKAGVDQTQLSWQLWRTDACE